MIKFFRRIRQNLIMENKSGKYFKYAIGEIVLVVIGILIALQINNWNESRKEKIAIKNVLNEIKEDLLEDTTALEKIIEQRTQDFEAQKRIISALEQNTKFNDSIRSDFGHVSLFRPFYSASKGYELLKELNLASLDDKDLRSVISRYYEREIPAVHQENNDDKFEFETFWLPYVREHLSEWKFEHYAVPRDYTQILKDEILLTFLKTNVGNVNSTIDAYTEALQTSEVLIEMIEAKNRE